MGDHEGSGRLAVERRGRQQGSDADREEGAHHDRIRAERNMPMTSTTGTVAQLWVKRSHRGRMDAATEVTLVEGEGVQGSADRKGSRQVTILSAERWARLANQIGAAPDPIVRRANVLVTGLALPLRRGSILCLGTTRIRIKGETRPCERMDEAVPGLRAAMREDLGGGLYGEVVTGGRLGVGDEVAWAEDAQLSLLDESDGA